MRNNLVLCSLVVLSACASVTRGTTQTVLVSTPGAEGATCSLVQTPAGNTSPTYHVTTPGSVAVERSRHALDVRCTKEGYSEGRNLVQAGFEEMTLGNVLVGGVIGLGIDAASGAINEYPDTILIEMKPVEIGETLPSPPSDEPSVGDTVKTEEATGRAPLGRFEP
jgi:hypothetical protein